MADHNTLLRQLGNIEPVIYVDGLCRDFGSLRAVKDLDLVIMRGEVFGFLGPNGAGKSTAIRMMMGLMAPTAGEVSILGMNVVTQLDDLRPKMGYMPQRFSLYTDLSVEENLDFAATIFGLGRKERRQRIETVLEEYGLGERRRQRPATLSGGWRQRLALAAAVVHEPELVFLDEPTAGVDPDSRRLFWDKLFDLAERGTTLLVSTHYMDEALRCHRLCVLKEGERVALNRPSQLVRAIEGRVIELWGEPMGEMLRLLRNRPEVASVTQLGTRAHVLISPTMATPERALSSLTAFLAEHIKNLSGEVAEANLEDALIALSRGALTEAGTKTLEEDVF